MAKISNVTFTSTPVGDLQTHPENPRQGDVGAIAESMEAHGFYGVVVAQLSSSRILAGNHRWRAAKALGIDEIPVAWIDVDDDEARRILLADNRTNDLASYDPAGLADLLRSLAEGEGLMGTGYSGDDLDELLRDLEGGGRLAPSYVPIEMLAPHPRNYRTHPPEQIRHLAASIEQHGFYRNVVTARDGTILAGHGIVLAARALDRQTVPVLRLDLDPFEPRALSILAADNNLGNMAEQDDRALTELLRDLAAEDALLGTGFDEQQLAALAMVTRPAGEIADLAAAGEWLGLPGFEAAARYPQITVKFETAEDRDRFAEMAGITTIIKRVGEAWAVWWPPREREDLSAIRYDVEDGDGDG